MSSTLLPERVENESVTMSTDDANCSSEDDGGCLDQIYLFDRTEVKTTLIIAYTFVFFCCFIGNLLVILVVVLHQRLRTATNFFLANLAFADLCVGVFCVYQNLTQYLITSWVWGEFLCKMYHFVQTLSYTSSVAILTVIAVERYLAIVHPIRSKQIMTLGRLKLVIGFVWLLSAAYSSPRLIMYGTGTDPFTITDGKPEIICVLRRTLYDTKIYDSVNFALCFLLPLTVITGIYIRIAMELWKESANVKKAKEEKTSSATLYEMLPIHGNSFADESKEKLKSTLICCVQCTKDGRNKASNDAGMVVVDKDSPNSSFLEPPSSPTLSRGVTFNNDVSNGNLHRVQFSDSVIRARRKVVRMLIAVVFSFALCNLPYHARKMWQYWTPRYDGSSEMAGLLTPVTFLVMYLNAGLNPILYAFLSSHFRKSMRDVLLCRILKLRHINRQTSSRSTMRTQVTSSQNECCR